MLRTILFLLMLSSPFNPLFAQTLTDQAGDPVEISNRLQAFDLPLALPRGELTTIPAGDVIEGDYISEMRFTPAGDEVWVLNRTTANITVLDWASQSVKATIEVGNGPMDLAFSNDLAVVACFNSNEVYLIQLSDYAVATTFSVPEQPAKVRVSRDGSLAAVACDVADQVVVLDLLSQQEIAVIPDFPIYLYKFSFITSNPRNTVYWSGFEISPDNQYLINGADDTGLHFYEIATGTISTTIPAAANTGQVALSGDGTRLIAMALGQDALISQIDVQSQSLLNQVAVTGESVWSPYSPPAVNMDGSKALVPTYPGHTSLVDFDNEDFTVIPTGSTPDWVASSADYSKAIAGDYFLSVIDFASGTLSSSFEGISIQNGTVSPAHDRLMGIDPLRYEWVHFFSFDEPSGLDWLGQANSGSELEADATYSTAFTPDGQLLFAMNALSGTASIIDVESATLLEILDLGSAETYHVDFTSDSKYAVVAKRLENTVAVIDLTTFEIVANVNAGGSKPDQVYVLPGDQYAYAINAAAPDRIGVIQLDGANSSLLTNFNIGNTGISWTNYGLRSDLKFDPNGEYAILANPFDDAVQMIDLESHTVVNTIPVPGFPLQLAVAGETALNTLVGVTLKNNSAMGLISGVGPSASYAGSFEMGGNPTRIAYDPVGQQFGIASNDDQSVEFYDLQFLDFTTPQTFINHTPIAVQFAENGRQFTLLLSNDTELYPHLLQVDSVQHELPALPIHFFAINPAGTLAAVAFPGTDEVLLFKEAATPVGWESIPVSLNPGYYRAFPNPAVEELHFAPIQIMASDPVRLSLFAADGSLLYQATFPGSQALTIQRSLSWSAGSYHYRIERGGKNLAKGTILFR